MYCTLDSTLSCRYYLRSRQKSIWKHYSFPSTASLISTPRGKRCLATDAYEHCSKGGAGVWSLPDCQGRVRQKSHSGIFKSSRDGGAATAVWAGADTITHPLEGAIAMLQRSHLNGLALSRRENAILEAEVLPNVSKLPLQPHLMSKQQTPLGWCCFGGFFASQFWPE